MELHYAILSNKKNQTTRFVRALLRGIQSLLRNLPCIYAIHGQIAKESAEEFDNTTAKIALKQQEKISDGTFIASIVGLVQILEEYALVSLDAQSSKFFRTVFNYADMHMKNKKI